MTLIDIRRTVKTATQIATKKGVAFTLITQGTYLGVERDERIRFERHAKESGIHLHGRECLPITGSIAFRTAAVTLVHPESMEPIVKAGEIITWECVDTLWRAGVDYVVVVERMRH